MGQGEERVSHVLKSVLSGQAGLLVELLLVEHFKQFGEVVSRHIVSGVLNDFAASIAIGTAQNSPPPKELNVSRRINNDVIYVGANHNDVYINRRPESFLFNGKEYRNNVWKDLLVQLCTLVAHENAVHAKRMLNIFGSRRKYFSENPTELHEGRLVVDGVFVEVNLSANNIKALCDAVHDYFGYGTSLQIKIV